MKKPQLLLLHGALGTSHFCDELIPFLSPHFELISLDFMGHGTSILSEEPLSIDLYARQLYRFLKEKNIDKPVVFGYSMGAYVALYLELLYPETFTRITTFATLFDWTEENAQMQVNMLDWDKIQEKVPPFAASMIQLHGEKTADLFKAMQEMMMKMGRTPPINLNQLANITIPVRIGVGDKDKTVSLEESLAAYRQLSKGSLFILPDTPHNFEKVRPAILAQMIVNP